MKTYIWYMVGIVLFFWISWVSAVQYPDWDNLRIDTQYNEYTDVLTIYAHIRGDSNVANRTSFGIDIAGGEYRKFFTYNDTTKELEVSFDISQSRLAQNYPYTVNIKNVQWYDLYNTEGNIYFPEGITTSDQTTQNDNGVYIHYPAGLSRPWNAVNNEIFFNTSNTPGYININNQNVFENLDVDTWYTYTPEIPNNIEYIVPDTIQPIINRPTYNSQYDEPKQINGIGNKKHYQSWRAR